MILLKVFLAFLLFFPISCSENNCYCEPQTIGADVDEIVIESKVFPYEQCSNGTCTWQIMPHPEKDILLEFWNIKFSRDNKLEVYQLIDQPNDSWHKFKLHTYRYIVTYDDPKSYRIPKNSGLELVETRRSGYNSKNFKLSIKRVENRTLQSGSKHWYKFQQNDNASCGQSYNVINEQLQFIEKAGNIKTSCLYKLVSPPHFNPRKGRIMFGFEGMNETFAGLHFLAPNNVTKIINIRDDTAILVDSDDYLLQIENQMGDDTAYNRPTISVQYVGERCKCDTTPVEIPKNGTITLKSPGYPDINCPSLSCETTIKTDRTSQEGMVDILLFSFANSSFPRGDAFEVSNAGKYIYTSIERPFLTNFVISYQDHIINYHTGNSVQRRLYDLNITRISIPKECRCSLLGEKKITKKSKFSMIISSNCDFIYCSWNVLMEQNLKIAKSDTARTIIEFYVKNPHSNDRVEIISRDDRDIFQQGDLKYKRSYSTTKVFSLFLFTRDARDSMVKNNTELSIQWRYEKIMNCKEDTKVITLTTTPFVLASQQWPDTYRNDEECRYLFTAPEGHTIHVLIDEIHIESHHDNIQFYQGNTTNTVFKSFTGSHTNIEFDSESNQMVFEFTTDGSDVDKGFHMNLVAVKKVVTTTPPTTTITATSAQTTISTVMPETTTQPDLDDDPELLTGTDIMGDELEDSVAIHTNVNTTSSTQDTKPDNDAIKRSESSTSYFWIVSLCFNIVLISGILIYKFRNSLKTRMGHAIQFSRNEFESFVSLSRSEQSQQTDAPETTEMNDL